MMPDDSGGPSGYPERLEHAAGEFKRQRGLAALLDAGELYHLESGGRDPGHDLLLGRAIETGCTLQDVRLDVLERLARGWYLAGGSDETVQGVIARAYAEVRGDG